MHPKHRRVILEVAGACNRACVYCPVTPKKNLFLPLEEVMHRVEERAAEAGMLRYLGISGGEPLLHPEIAAIAGYFSANAETVVLATNGSMPITNIRRIDNLGIQVHLPSLDAHEFAGITGINPASSGEILAAVLENIETFRQAAGLGIYLTVVLTELNCSEKTIGRIILLAEERKLRIRFSPVIVTRESMKGLFGSGVIRAMQETIPALVLEGKGNGRIELAGIDATRRTITRTGLGIEEYIRLDGTSCTSLFHAYCG